MERVELGRTGLMVSPAGLGCGGYSRLGMRDSSDDSGALAVVRHALELGINFFDTARAYGTEEVVGRGIAGRRADVVISTKTMFRRKDGYMAAPDIVDSLEKSLARLGTDYVDVFSLHGVTHEHYEYCVAEYLPELQRQQSLGKIRALGITESFQQEPTHQTLLQALEDDHFDVIMVGFNFLNTAARDKVFPLALEHNVGTQIMHAVRNALSNRDVLIELVAALVAGGEIDPATVNLDDPVGFLTHEEGLKSVTEAAYRYCRHEPGVNVVLTGTGSTAHLTENCSAILAPALNAEVRERLHTIFGRVRSVSGD